MLKKIINNPASLAILFGRVLTTYAATTDEKKVVNINNLQGNCIKLLNGIRFQIK